MKHFHSSFTIFLLVLITWASVLNGFVSATASDKILTNVYDQNVDDGMGGVPAAAHYAYDGVGNLSTMSYSNGVQHAYTYNNLNRLTNLTVTDSLSNILHSYSHTLNAAGHKTQVVEADGRTVNYAFDQLYRLTSETIAASPGLSGSPGVNGVASYAYDQVSNRISRTSNIAGVINQSFAVNNNDQITGAGYSFDDNGSTTQSPDGSADVYSFENKLIRRVNTGLGLTIDMLYSATGDRVSKTTNGITTNYLVNTNNHTGYAQVVEETDGATGNLTAVFVYGHDLVSQDRADGAGGFAMSFYSYDGLGSVRGLTDAIGTSLGNYHYDAYGLLIENTVSVANPYQFAGERFDNDMGLYYLRARYLDVETGRFHTLDSYEGSQQNALTLHKYLYANGNPVSGTDPSGNMTLVELTTTVKGLASLAGFSIRMVNIGFEIQSIATAVINAIKLSQAVLAISAGLDTSSPESFASTFMVGLKRVFGKEATRAGPYFFNGFSAASKAFGKKWKPAMGAFLSRLPFIAARAANGMKKQIPTIAAAAAKKQLRMWIGTPSGRGKFRGGGIPIPLGKRLGVLVQATGGRLFGFHVQPKGKARIPIMRVDYWDVRPGYGPFGKGGGLHLHYHVPKKMSRHHSIWKP